MPPASEAHGNLANVSFEAMLYEGCGDESADTSEAGPVARERRGELPAW